MGWVRHLFNTCLRDGKFPRSWKCASLVLIPKSDKPTADELPKARPICLLNELGKALERIIANRIYEWQLEHPESDFSGNQFGFRKQRSTCDAIALLKEITSSAVKNKGFAVAVSLDIRNAFNSVPWRTIRRALRRKGFPTYIRRIVDSYLSDRYIWYTGKDGRRQSRSMEADVPQGSVLGPVLWNIAFDSVLALAEEEEEKILCYADDTMIVVTGKNWRSTIIRAQVLINRVINKITSLGLEVSQNKIEAILFHGKGAVGLPSGIMVGGTLVNFSPSIKYLGIMIDIKWSFSFHFQYTEEKANRVVRALNWLMPNLRGPDERRRRLFANTVMSVILYGAPVWGDTLAKSQKQPAIHRLQRTIAQRVISAYRTVSSNAALVLARLPPVKLVAGMRKRIYDEIKLRKEDESFLPEHKKEIKEVELQKMYDKWREQLERPNQPGQRTLMAIVPRLEEWMSRKSDSMSFHLTQIMTGHECFPKFLHRIGKRANTACDFCGKDLDDASHTLKNFPA